MEELGQVLCSCGSFLCQWFCTELENCISSESMGSQLGGQFWNLMEVSFRDAVSDNF